MTMNAAHWTVTRSTGAIRYTGPDHGVGGESYATALEFHRWLQDKADDATSTGDDQLDITDENPSNRQTDNIVELLGLYNIDDTASEHIFDGSIIQGSGDDIYDAIVNYGNSDVQIQVHQDGAVLSDDWWNQSGVGLNADAAQGISHRFLIKVRSSGTDIDGRRLLGTCRRFGKTFSEFPINGTSRGNNVFALKDTDDLNNATAEGTVSGMTTIVNSTEGYVGIDVDNNAADEFYYSEWDKATYSINQFFERMKWLTRDGSVSTIYGLNGELFRGITHEITIDTPTGTFNAVEAVSWTGGTGQMFAINSTTAATKMWIQLLTGVPPTDGQVITGGTSSATVAVNVTVTARPISTPFVGASTGTALIGSYGLGLEATDLSANDKVFDLSDTLITPPNYVTFTVGGLISSEDNVLVGPWDGSATDNEGNPEIDYNQFTLNGALTGGEATIPVNGTVSSDTPSTGTIRVFDGTKFVKVSYTGFTSSSFTGCTGTPAASTSNEVFISYIDTVAGAATEDFTGVFDATRQLVCKVRDGGGTPIKEFISSASLGSNGGSITAIRASDA